MGHPFWGRPNYGDPATKEANDLPQAYGPWDQILMAGQMVPGIVRVSGKKGQRMDSKLAPGMDGSTDTHLGYDNADILLRVTLWTAAHWTAWQALIPLIQPKPNKGQARPVDVYHPGLAPYGIRKLYVKDLSIPEPGPKSGDMIVTITCSEFRPQTKGGILTPKTSINSVPRNGAAAGTAQSPTTTVTAPTKTKGAAGP